MIVAALACATALAHAEGGPALRVAGVAPFSRVELEEALRLRLGPEHRVDVTADAPSITVTVDGRSRSIVLGAERGVAAARVVALVAAGLAFDGPGRIEVGSGPSIVAAFEPPRPQRPWSVTVAAGQAIAPHAAQGLGVSLGLERGFADGTRARWTLELGVAVASVPERTETAPIRTLAVPLRVGVIVGDRAALATGAIVEPYTLRVDDGAGDGDRSALLGGFVAGRVLVAGWTGVDLMLRVGFDVLATRTEYRLDGVTVLDTGRYRPWIALGGAWGGGS